MSGERAEAVSGEAMSGESRVQRPRMVRSRPPAAPARLRDVTKRRRNLALLMATLRSALSCAGVLAVYYALPLSDADLDMKGIAALLIGATLFIAVGAWQIRSIMHARFPQLRAVEALAIIFPLFFVSYAIAYVLMAGEPGMFNQHLSHTSALYFVIVTFGTVGYGDIAPTNGAAQLVVASQILLDLVLLGVVFKLVFGISKMSLERGVRADGAGEELEDELGDRLAEDLDGAVGPKPDDGGSAGAEMPGRLADR